jgi:hypothetical protein
MVVYSEPMTLSVLKNEVQGLQQGMAEGSWKKNVSLSAKRRQGIDAANKRLGVAEGSGPQVGDAVYYGKRLVGWFKGYSEHGKIITEPNYEEMGDEYANRDVYWDPQDKITIKPEQGMAEGFSLKKTNVDKYMEPGDPDEYTQDVNIKDTDYEIINNKTGQVVGTASWTTNDFMGPGALKITMKNGATRWLDIWASEQGNPQSAFNRFVKDPKTAKKYKEQGVAENMADDMAAMAQKKFPTAYISKDGKEVQKPENWGKQYTPPAAPPADLEKQRRDLTAKYPNIDELVRRAELNRDPDYEMADGQAYYAARDAEQNYQKLRQIQRVIQGLNEHKERQNNMRTKEITESQLDEISLDQIGRGIGGVLGGVGKTVGAVAGVPQGIGRAVKKGYRGAVKGIGGAADDGSNPQSDVPGAAYGDTSQGKELPTGTGEINPATGRAYVPSDFGNQADDIAAAGGAENSPAAIQQQIRTVERNYQTQMADLTAKLKSAQTQGGASGPALSKQQQDYISAIGTDQPAAGSTSVAPSSIAAPDRSYEVNPTAPSMARDPKVLNTLQAMNAKELQIIKKILQARARATNESELSEVAFGDVWRGTGDRLKNATSGIRSAASGAASAVKGAAASAADMAKSAYKTAKPYVKKAGKFAAAVPGAVATGAGAVAGGVAGMKNAARKGYAAGQKHVGGGALTMDELQQAIGGMTADDAKQLLTFIKQLEIQNAPAKSKAKPKAKTSTTTPTTTTTTTPTWTGRQKDLAAVAESLTWSRSFDPGMIVYKRMKSGR